MKNQFQQLYDLIYSPIITPYSLLENAKLDNYEYVNYSKAVNGLLVSMKCEIEPGYKVIFNYYFDEKDFLQRVEMVSSGEQELIFDRESETISIKDRICETRKKIRTTIAI